MRKLACPFGHPAQVSTQVQLAATCESVWPRLKQPWSNGLASRRKLKIKPEKFENAAISAHFGFVFERENLAVKSHGNRDVKGFQKLRYQNVFRPH